MISQVINGNPIRRELEMADCKELYSFFCRFGMCLD
jgi:hypothetical protein